MCKVGVFGLLIGVMAISCALPAQTIASATRGSLLDSGSGGNALMPGALPSSSAAPAPDSTSCSPFDLQTAPELSWRQRTCLYRSRLLSKSFPMRAALFSAVSELRKNDIKSPGMEDFTHRMATYYARRTAQSTGELLAGYLNHEDPRYHPSTEHGVWRRTHAALESVMITKDLDGSSRMAFAPIAGAFGSGMVSVGVYQYHNSVGDGLRRSATTYSFYFANALAREFRPELTGLTSHFLHRR